MRVNVFQMPMLGIPFVALTQCSNHDLAVQLCSSRFSMFRLCRDHGGCANRGARTYLVFSKARNAAAPQDFRSRRRFSAIPISCSMISRSFRIGHHHADVVLRGHVLVEYDTVGDANLI